MMERGVLGAYAHAAGRVPHLVQRALASGLRHPSGHFPSTNSGPPERFWSPRIEKEI